jgi:hypothetical protein
MEGNRNKRNISIEWMESAFLKKPWFAKYTERDIWLDIGTDGEGHN